MNLTACEWKIGGLRHLTVIPARRQTNLSHLGVLSALTAQNWDAGRREQIRLLEEWEPASGSSFKGHYYEMGNRKL